jgi:hypothetical protein
VKGERWKVVGGAGMKRTSDLGRADKLGFRRVFAEDVYQVGFPFQSPVSRLVGLSVASLYE